jgi:hypothetical protein
VGKSTYIKDFIKQWSCYETPEKSYRELIKEKNLPHSKEGTEESQRIILDALNDFSICPSSHDFKCAVFAKESNSHAKLWTDFVNELIKWFSEKNPGCIFLLMGKFAQSKKIFINEKHKIFNTIHPSPLSAHVGFFGCNVFKEINDYLDKPIHW